MARVLINFREADMALYEHVMNQEDKTKYIRRLIREDMSRDNNVPTPTNTIDKSINEIDDDLLNSYI